MVLFPFLIEPFQKYHLKTNICHLSYRWLTSPPRFFFLFSESSWQIDFELCTGLVDEVVTVSEISNYRRLQATPRPTNCQLEFNSDLEKWFNWSETAKLLPCLVKTLSKKHPNQPTANYNLTLIKKNCSIYLKAKRTEALVGQNPLQATPQPTNCQLKSTSLYLKLRRLIVKMKTKWLTALIAQNPLQATPHRTNCQVVLNSD